jgi:hypothetical protein
MDHSTVGVGIQEELNINLTLMKHERTGSNDEHCLLTKGTWEYKQVSKIRVINIQYLKLRLQVLQFIENSFFFNPGNMVLFD